MECDEALARAAELGGGDDGDLAPDVSRHVAACDPCRETLEAAREGLGTLAAHECRADVGGPPADAARVWRDVRGDARHGALRRIGRHAGRAAALLLAVTGALALAGVDVRPGTRVPALTRTDVDASVAAAVDGLSERLDERDRRRAGEFNEAAAWLDDRRRADVDALVVEMTALRRELAVVRFAQDALMEPCAPALPDPR